MDLIFYGIRVLFRTLILLGAMFFIGFVVFANAIANEPAKVTAKADGIVVLTGGRARISEAIKLLSEKKAKRLLITGVHPSTSVEELREMAATSDEPLFDCCIDIDRRALNTMDNANETRAWAERHDMTSLIVVTSVYHIPRALVELQRVMPAIELVPHAVVPSGLHFQAWWSDPRTARVVLSEYLKYIPALAILGASHLTKGLVRQAPVSRVGARQH